MARFHGLIGYATPIEETAPGVFEESYVERPCDGDHVRRTRRLQTGDQLNQNVVVADEVSVYADPYARQNYYMIRYVVMDGVKWTATSARVEYPKIVITLGGVYNAKSQT